MNSVGYIAEGKTALFFVSKSIQILSKREKGGAEQMSLCQLYTCFFLSLSFFFSLSRLNQASFYLRLSTLLVVFFIFFSNINRV